MRAQHSFETSVSVDQSTRRNIVDDSFSISCAFNGPLPSVSVRWSLFILSG